MKSYLSLIPAYAKVHRRQNRMTILCIVFAVFLVTAVFSMADMGITMEKTRLLNKHGSQALQELSSNATVQTLFSIAAFLSVLILIAGVLMISSSINNNVAQRTKFFGMMRCIGMSRQQIIRFVRLEALNWCKTAIPVGVLLGIAVTWGLCAALRFLVGGEFADIPLFQISAAGIGSGIILGVVTVLLAAGSPARRAARVSPIAAVSGNSEHLKNAGHAVKTRMFHIETALGIQHAVSEKKNLVLMIGSFALSIVLFLCFSVFIELIGYLMPQFSNAADIEISSTDGLDSIDGALLDRLSGVPGVKRVFGRRSSFDVPVDVNGGRQQVNAVDLISFSKFDLDCLAKDHLLKKGSDLSKVYGNSGYVLAISDAESPLKIGDQIQTGNAEVCIAGTLKYDPFSSDGSTNGKTTLITSEETYARLTGATGYSLVLVQTEGTAVSEDAAELRNLLGEGCTLRDRREQRTSGTYAAFLLCVYGFLAVITLVAVLNIMNSISMSVSARTKQYGAMRAVGMDERQITKMIAAETFTYALSGCAVGCLLGLLLSKPLYDTLITTHYSYAVWSVPVVPLSLILVFVLAAAVAAVWAPSKRMRKISVTETINDL